MTKEVINITRYVVQQKIEEIVKNPALLYESAFANPQLRQKLLLRVLNRTIPCYGIAPQHGMNIDRGCQFLLSPEEEKKIDQTIRENILKVLHEEDAIKHFYPYEQTITPKEPSHWFG